MGETNWLLVLTAAIFIVMAMVGYIRGFIKTIVNLVIGMVTFVLVMALSPKVCDFLRQTSLPQYVETKVETVIWEKVEDLRASGQEIILDGAGQGGRLIDELPFAPILKNTLLNNEQLENSADQGLEQFAAYISRLAAERIIVLAGYAMTFLIVFFVLRVVVFLLNILEHLPLLHGLNKLAGLAMGLLEGLLIVWVLGIALTIFNTTELGQSGAQCIRQSSFLTALYGHNLLEQIIFWAAK